MNPANLALRTMTKVLAIPGSLRANSSSNFILQAIISLAPENVLIEVYNDVGVLPHFNDPKQVPSSVSEFRKKVRETDAVLICTPEYAFGIPGSLKNALDWTVSSGDFIDKPVGLVTASSQGEKGHAALLLVLTAISAWVIDDATLLIPFVRSKLDAFGNIKDQQLTNELKKVVENLSFAARKKSSVL
jgi:NAD(P)H-dependent FMN reductase